MYNIATRSTAGISELLNPVRNYVIFWMLTVQQKLNPLVEGRQFFAQISIYMTLQTRVQYSHPYLISLLFEELWCPYCRESEHFILQLFSSSFMCMPELNVELFFSKK